MARSRNIKPGFFDNVALSKMPPLARLLFAGMWCYCDRDGRIEDEPQRIKAKVLPYDKCDVDKFLDGLAAGTDPFITRYQISGRKYIQVLAWKKHQNPHVKEQASTYPAPDMHHASTIPVREIPALALLSSDSSPLIPSSLSLGDDDETISTIGRWLQDYIGRFDLDWGLPSRGLCGKIHGAMNGKTLDELEVLFQEMHARKQAPARSYAWFEAVIRDHFAGS